MITPVDALAFEQDSGAAALAVSVVDHHIMLAVIGRRDVARVCEHQWMTRHGGAPSAHEIADLYAAAGWRCRVSGERTLWVEIDIDATMRRAT